MYVHVCMYIRKNWIILSCICQHKTEHNDMVHITLYEICSTSILLRIVEFLFFYAMSLIQFYLCLCFYTALYTSIYLYLTGRVLTAPSSWCYCIPQFCASACGFF